MSKAKESLNARLNKLESQVGCASEGGFENQQQQPASITISDRLNAAESKMREVVLMMQETSKLSAAPSDVASSLRSISEFSEINEMKYASSIVGSKNRAELLLKQEEEILSVVESLEQIEKCRANLTFDPMIGIAEKSVQLNALEYIGKDQPLTLAFLQQNDAIEELIKSQADIVDALNKKFLYFDAVLTAIEQEKKK